MNIIEAATALKAGNKIARNLWKSDYLFYNAEFEMIFIGGGKNPDHVWAPTLDDLLADDYYIFVGNE